MPRQYDDSRFYLQEKSNLEDILLLELIVHQYFKNTNDFSIKNILNRFYTAIAHDFNYPLMCFTLMLAIILSDEMSVLPSA